MVSEDQVVHVAQGDIEAQQLCSFLEAHDIPTAIKADSMRLTHSFTLDGLGMVEIMVPLAKADEARELIRLVEKGALALPENQELME